MSLVQDVIGRRLANWEAEHALDLSDRFFLLLQGDGHTVVINIPRYLGAAAPPESRAKLLSAL